MEERLYILYEGRACANIGTDGATEVCVAHTEAEAKNDAKDMGYPVACYSYAIDGKNLDDERWEWDAGN